jgi:replication-associated recombination protein RarA
MVFCLQLFAVVFVCNIFDGHQDVVMFNRVNVTEDGKKALITLANGDMRKVLNVLQVILLLKPFLLFCNWLRYGLLQC